MPIKSLIRTIPHYPKPGVMFRDITTLLKDPAGFRLTISGLTAHYQDRHIDKIAAMESRGFIVGAAMAAVLGTGFVPLRKRGKLPAETIGHDYALEYGADRLEMHVDAVRNGERVLVADDVLATGGTAEAAAKLVRAAGGEIVGCCFVIEIAGLGGRERVETLGLPAFSLVQFDAG
ncbi:MAG: adenine phosphoribosyltransferase [Proteobacteria bacterium]|jgi:adenine phosphoribosyltransferase|nr:adenine phosphoribosyltransferase [Pseudomonadota bacterium]